MADVTGRAEDSTIDSLRRDRRRVAIPVDGFHRRNRGELVEHLVAADVAGMEDELDAGKDVMHLGPDETMRIGDQSDAPDGVVHPAG